jgi:peptidoglycan hydrolase CwlO-like protein
MVQKQLKETQDQLREERLKNSDLETRVQMLDNTGLGGTDLSHKVTELQAENRKLEATIKDLCQSPFIKDASERVMSRTKVTSLEKDLERNSVSLKH